MLHFERFIQMFSLIMLETLKKLWSITYRATHQLQNYFGPVTAPRESELDINALIRSLYYREEIPEFIIPLFFVIPKAFEKMPDENVLKMIRCLACPLVEQLPWLKKTPDLQVHESTIDEQKISAYIHQYCETIEQQPVHFFTSTLGGEDAEQPFESIFNSYMSTVIAYVSLDIMSAIVIEKFPHHLEIIAQLERSQTICNLFLINKSLDLRLEYKHVVLAAVFDTLLSGAVTNPDAQVPTYIKQIEKSLKKIIDYKGVKHCITISSITHRLDYAQSFSHIEPLFFELIKNSNKPLIDVWNYNGREIQTIVSLIFNDKPEPLKCKTLLALLLNGLKASSEDQDPTARLNFLYYLHRKYVLTHEESRYKESILALMISTFLDEEGKHSSDYVINFLGYVLPGDHFGLALAFCLSTVISLSPPKKKEIFTCLMQTTEPSQGIAINWFNMMNNPKLPSGVAERFYILFRPCIDEHCFINSNELNSLLNAFNEILLQYWQIKSQHPSLFLKDKADSLVKMNRIADKYLDVINKASGYNLSQMVLSTLDCHESTTKVVLISLIRSKPLADIFNALLHNDRTHKDPLVPNQNICYEEDYLSKISRVLSRLDLKKTPLSVLDVVLSNEDALFRAKSLLMLLLIVSRKTTCPIIPKQTLWINWALSLLKDIVVTYKDRETSEIMSHLITSLDVCALLPKERQKLFLFTLQPNAPLKTPIAEIVAEQPKSRKHKKKSSTKSCEAVADDFEPSSEATITVAYPFLLMPIQSPIALSKDNNPTLRKDSLPESSISACSLEDLPPITCSRDPEILLNAQHDCTEADLSRSREQVMGRRHLNCQETLTSDAPNMSTKKVQTPLAKFHKSLLTSVSQIMKAIDLMGEVQVLPALEGCFIRVQESAVSIQQLLIPQSGAGASEELQKKTNDYFALDNQEKLDLEKEWNKELAEFSWNLQRALEKYLKTEIDVKQLTENKTIIENIKSALTSLSFCYYKNPTLHINEATLHCLRIIEKYYQGKDVRLSIKGSIFACPLKARDLDLLLISENPVEKTLVDKSFIALSTQMGGSIATGSIYQPHDFCSQEIQIILPDNPQINIDLIFWKKPLSSEQELEKTSLAFLSMCAVNWYLDGHACMQPQTARAICCDSPVLKVLLELKTIEDYIGVAGYFLKNIIKYGDFVRYDQHISRFLANYIDTKTRIIALPAASQGDIETNQIIVSAGLDYLFNRFSSRTTETIDYILDKKLLLVLFPLSIRSHKLCANYFADHFSPTDAHNFPSNLSGPAFLAMYFIGAIVDQSEEKKREVIEEIIKSLIICQKYLNITISTTIRILEMIPTSIYAWDEAYTAYKIQKTSQKRLSFEIESLLLIFQMWHPTIERLSNESVALNVATEGSLHSPRFFSPSMGNMTVYNSHKTSELTY